MKDENKDEVFTDFFASVFICKTNSSEGTQLPELEDGDREWDETYVIWWETVSDFLHVLNAHKSMRLDRIHPRVLKDLAELFNKLFSITY